jgi:hypothetical protein
MQLKTTMKSDVDETDDLTEHVDHVDKKAVRHARVVRVEFFHPDIFRSIVDGRLPKQHVNAENDDDEQHCNEIEHHQKLYGYDVSFGVVVVVQQRKHGQCTTSKDTCACITHLSYSRLSIERTRSD